MWRMGLVKNPSGQSSLRGIRLAFGFRNNFDGLDMDPKQNNKRALSRKQYEIFECTDWLRNCFEVYLFTLHRNYSFSLHFTKERHTYVHPNHTQSCWCLQSGWTKHQFHTLECHRYAGDPLACTITCKWTHDLENVVLEMTAENSKTATDAVPCSIRSLIHELEETDIVDTGLHAHSCERPGPQESTETGNPMFNKICCMIFTHLYFACFSQYALTHFSCFPDLTCQSGLAP